MTPIQAGNSEWVETRFREDDHPLWKQTFPAHERRTLVDDDLAAGRSISAVLLTIVTIGLLLTAGATLWISMR